MSSYSYNHHHMVQVTTCICTCMYRCAYIGIQALAARATGKPLPTVSEVAEGDQRAFPARDGHAQSRSRHALARRARSRSRVTLYLGSCQPLQREDRSVSAGRMILEVVSTLVLCFFGYAVYVLYWTKAEPGLGGPIEDFIAAEDDGELAEPSDCTTA